VFRVHDIDGDGLDDFAISGAGWFDGAGNVVGLTFIGAGNGRSPHEIIGDLPPPVGAGASFGTWVSNYPDLDGDGLPELLVSEPEAGSGRVHLSLSKAPTA